jgi:cation-transporting ATPase 13A2
MLAAVPSSHSLGNLADARQPPSPGRGGSAASSHGGVSLTVLHPDGSVTDAAPRGSVLAAVMTGDMECAVTGKGFDALLARPDPELVQPMLRRGAVFARMSPDNKRDLMHLLGNGLESAPLARPLGLHVGAPPGGVRLREWGRQGAILDAGLRPSAS